MKSDLGVFARRSVRGEREIVEGFAMKIPAAIEKQVQAGEEDHRRDHEDQYAMAQRGLSLRARRCGIGITKGAALPKRRRCAEKSAHCQDKCRRCFL